MKHQTNINTLTAKCARAGIRCLALLGVLTAFFAAAFLSSCDRRDIYEEGKTAVPVIVSMDWRNLGSDPSGASIYFYPEDGSKPYTFVTNSVGKATVQVPSGYYTVIVFNRSVNEYGTMHFSRMASLGTAQSILEFRNSWAGTADSVGRTVCEPEVIVCGRTDHFHVREISNRIIQEHPNTRATDDTLTYDQPVFVPDTCYSVPQRMIYTATVNIETDSIQNARSVRSYLTGMAGADYLATRSATDTLATFVIENWKISHDEGEYTKGYLVGTFTCFGLPEQYRLRHTADQNRLFIKVLLVDGKTTVSASFRVGDLIVQNNDEFTDELTVGTLVLPNVKPEGGSTSGFNVTFEDWGDTEDIVVPI